MKRLVVVLGIAALLSGCGSSGVGRGNWDNRSAREQRCRELSMDMRSTEDANASADMTATGLARSNSYYNRYRCSDFERN